MNTTAKYFYRASLNTNTFKIFDTNIFAKVNYIYFIIIRLSGSSLSLLFLMYLDWDSSCYLFKRILLSTIKYGGPST